MIINTIIDKSNNEPVLMTSNDIKEIRKSLKNVSEFSNVVDSLKNFIVNRLNGFNVVDNQSFYSDLIADSNTANSIESLIEYRLGKPDVIDNEEIGYFENVNSKVWFGKHNNNVFGISISYYNCYVAKYRNNRTCYLLSVYKTF